MVEELLVGEDVWNDVITLHLCEGPNDGWVISALDVEANGAVVCAYVDWDAVRV